MNPYLMASKAINIDGIFKFVMYGFLTYVAYKLYKKFTINPLGLGDSVYDGMSKDERKALIGNAKTSEGATATAVDKARARLSGLKLNGKPVFVNSAHQAIANSFENAMKGAQTDESKIIPVIKSMNPTTLLCVFVAYGVRKTRLTLDNWIGSYTTGNLIDHLQDDLSENEFNEIRPYFRKASLL